MSASFLHIPCTRPQQRCPQLSCRADQASGASDKQQQHSSTRRRALGAALLLPAAAVVAGPRRAAAEELAAAAAAPPPTEAVASPPALDVVSWPQWVDRNFSFSYPPGFKEVADLSYAMPPKPTSGSPTDQVVENPLKAEVRSSGGEQRINVVVRQAAAYQRTLLQVTDISQLGDARKVAKLLIPPGAVVAGVTSTAVAQPPRDTGTVLGVIERQPVTYYTYDLLLPDPAATRVQLTAAAQLGRLYVLAASAPGQEWGEAGPLLREAALSFRVRYKI
ncbi:hypothetical protein D9Q98_008667 [Chlorella vulgaris]|uniref:PsbP C-terminal domain-containing protein n=1 Tax=Chlorella vulgaris TaxID=3077 RepID=A0A9D4TIF3_CHLVU|nr:hypothetical protein D9Q98_008667 [Chlorella vulgaris]